MIDGVTNATTTVTDPNALDPYAVAVNSATNQIYVANIGTGVGAHLGNVTVIDGATNTTTTVTDSNANHPAAVAVNSLTNKIYVTNTWTNNLTVIDGGVNSATTVSDPNAVQPWTVVVNERTNKVYVANAGGTNVAGGANPGSITVIDGSSNATTSIINPNASYSDAVGVNPMTDQIYVGNLYGNNYSGNLTVLNGAGKPNDAHALGITRPPECRRWNGDEQSGGHHLWRFLRSQLRWPVIALRALVVVSHDAPARTAIK